MQQLLLLTVAGNKSERLTFETLSGSLTAVRDVDFISMDLPLNDPQPLQVSTVAPNIPLTQEFNMTRQLRKILFSNFVAVCLRFLRDDYYYLCFGNPWR